MILTGREKADHLGTLELINDMMVNSLGFLFASYIPDLKLKLET